MVALGMVNLVGAGQRAVDLANEIGGAVGRVQALVGVHLTGVVGVRRDLPTREINRLQSGLGHLHRLVPGDRTERTHARPRFQGLP